MVPFTEGASLAIGARQVTLTDPGGNATRHRSRSSTRRIGVSAGTARCHSAEIAYIMYQVPVLMAVHAAEMLPKEA